MNPKQDLGYQRNTATQPPPNYYQNLNTSYGATRVVVGQPVRSTYVTTSVSDNMGLAIFACLCCFWPLGLMAICRASESRDALIRGDIQSAITSSNDARRFSIISIAIGVLVMIGAIIAVAVVVTSNTRSYH